MVSTSKDNSWTPLHAQLHQILRVRQILPQNQRLLVAVSGGQDSVCLIKLLLDLQPKWGWQLGIAHCDHRWRSDSKANAEFVEQLAENWQVSFYLQIADRIYKSEAAARNWRYQALQAIARRNNYQYVVTGHTASDRAETLLYNLIRGSGADGLSSLNWSRPFHSTESNSFANFDRIDFPPDIYTFSPKYSDFSSLDPVLPVQFPVPPECSSTKPKFTPQVGEREAINSSNLLLVRPLLEIDRAQTGKFCQDQQLEIWEDSTNQDFSYARNRIRLELLPYLKTHFNPQAEFSLAQTAELLRAEVEYLEEEARQLLLRAMDFNSDFPGESSEDLPFFPSDTNPSADFPASMGKSMPSTKNIKYINRLTLRDAPLALQRRAMRVLLQSVLPVSPNFENVEKLTALIKAPNRSQTDPFPGGAIAQVQHPWILLRQLSG